MQLSQLSSNRLAPLLVLAWGMSALVVTACGGTALDNGSTSEPSGGTTRGSGGSAGGSIAKPGDAWKTLHACKAGDPNDSISINSLRLDEKTEELLVQAGHSAGCATHQFGLCFSEEFAESEPVQVQLQLLHDDGGEMCEAYAMSNLKFDLSPLRDEYETRYGSKQGQIRINMGGESVVYTFGGTQVDAPTWETIDLALDRLNHCEVVDDCTSIGTRSCTGTYINNDEDVTIVTGMMDARRAVDGTGDAVCNDACRCGILRCTNSKCETASGDCMDAPAESQMICL